MGFGPSIAALLASQVVQSLGGYLPNGGFTAPERRLFNAVGMGWQEGRSRNHLKRRSAEDTGRQGSSG